MVAHRLPEPRGLAGLAAVVTDVYTQSPPLFQVQQIQEEAVAVIGMAKRLALEAQVLSLFHLLVLRLQQLARLQLQHRAEIQFTNSLDQGASHSDGSLCTA